MQQELIRMLEKVTEHIVICNNYDQRFSSTSYGASLLNEAEALVEKAKNSVKEPAVPQGLPLHRCTNCQAIYQDQPPTQCDCMPDKQEYEVGFASFPKTPAAPSQPMTDEEKQALVYEKLLACLHCGATSQKPVTLTDERLREIDDAHNWQRTEGRMAAYRAIIAAMREKEGK